MTNKSSFSQSLEIIFPEHCNHYGTLFGGQALQLLSKTAFVVATQFARKSVVMAAVNGVQFLQPIPQGSTLHLRGWITRLGASSMTVCVHGLFNQPATAPELALKALFEMVAVDAQGKPEAIDPSFCDGVNTQ